MKKTNVYYLIFLLLLGIPGLLSVEDYGIAWDEPQQRLLGEQCYNYIFNDFDDYLNFKDRHYGVAVELPLIIVEKLFIAEYNEPAIYRTRHLLTHLFFLLSVCFFFLLLKRVFGKNWLALLGALMLLLSPRIFAHSFFNSKDIPFMSMMIISIYTMILSGKRKYSIVALHGIITGLLINIRILGILIIGLTLLFYFLENLQCKKWKDFILKSSVYTVIALISVYLTWPFLWTDPLGNFLESFAVMGQFNWDDPVLFFGKQIPGNELPWYYIPSWISISIPFGYLLAIIAGIILLLIDFLRNPGTIIIDFNIRILCVSLIGVILPVTIVIFGNSTLYDDWRQMYFIYPLLLLIAMYGIDRIDDLLKERHVIASILFVVFTIYIGVAGIKMISLHPYQQVYFNELVPKTDEYIRKHFDMDYWGLSYYEALQNILERDDSETINIVVANTPGRLNKMLLDDVQQDRINFVDIIDKADYFISNYRFMNNDYPYGDPAYSIERNGTAINSTWKLKPEYP